MKSGTPSLSMCFFSRLLFWVMLFFASSAKSQTATWQAVKSAVVNPGESASFALVAASKADGIIYGLSGQFAQTVYAWRNHGWELLGTGTSVPGGQPGNLRAMVTDLNGNVYVAGFITNAQGKYCVAKWDGHQWSEVGTGAAALNPNYAIFALATDNRGNVYAAGGFTNNAGRYYVAKWNGSKWSELGNLSTSLTADDQISCITTDAAGNVYAAGNLRDANNNLYIAKWNNSSWVKVGGGIPKTSESGYIYHLAVGADNKIYAAGDITNSNGYYYIAQLVGSTWSQLPVIPSSHLDLQSVSDLKIDASGNLLVAGAFIDNKNYYFIPKWNGTSWSRLGGDSLKAQNATGGLTIDADGNIFTCGGLIDRSSGYHYVAKWTKDSNSWAQLGVNGIGSLPHGADQFAVITPTNIYARQGNELYQWNGFYWTPMKFSDESRPGYRTIAADASGNLYCYSDFNNAPFNVVTKWDGATWTRLDTVGGFDAKLAAKKGCSLSNFIVSPNGVIYATELEQLGFLVGDQDYNGIIAKFDGKAWSEIPYATSHADVNIHGYKHEYIGSGADNSLYATLYNKDNDAYYIGRWSGTEWVAIGGDYPFVVNTYSNISIDKLNNIYIGIEWYDKSYGGPVTAVAKWNGKTWQVTRTPFVAPGVAGSNGKGYYATWGLGTNPNNYHVFTDANNTLTQVGDPPLDTPYPIDWLGIDIYGNLYAKGAFKDSLGPFNLARYGNSLLPVTITNFSGYLNKNNVVLNWHTNQEINTQYFNVERSTDGIHFSVTGRVNAAGNSNTVKKYTYTDDITGIDTNFARIFYRLAEADKDGAITRSKIVMLNHTNYATTWSAKIYPVPAGDVLQLELANCTKKTAITIYNNSGAQLLEQAVINANGVTPINIASLSQGIYFIKVFTKGESKTLKFIKH